MKAFKFASLFFLACLTASLSNCKTDDPSVSEAAKTTGLLTGGLWRIESVSVDNVVHDELFQDLTVSFTATGFTASNGDAVWPSNGTWLFTDQSATSFIRNDGVEVVIEEISDGQLVLSLSWASTTLGGGREKSMSGQNVFTFKK